MNTQSEADKPGLGADEGLLGRTVEITTNQASVVPPSPDRHRMRMSEARRFYNWHLTGIGDAGPEFQTAHMLLGNVISEHARLREALQKICYNGRNPIAEEALGLK